MHKRLNLRLSPKAAEQLKEVAEQTRRKMTTVIEMGIELIYKQEIKRNDKENS